MTEDLLNRVAETEYSLYVDPAFATPHRFGQWVRRADFAWRRELNALHHVHCRSGEVDELMAALDRLYEATGLPYRRLSYHCPVTVGVLDGFLRENGWTIGKPLAMVHRRPASRTVRTDLEFRAVPLAERLGDRAAVIRGDKWLTNGYVFRQAQDERLGGEAIVAYLKGKPVGSTGFYVVNNVARFRSIVIRKAFVRQGIATAMIDHIIRHPKVRAAEALVLFVGRDGPIHLYEQMGFDPVEDLHMTHATWQRSDYQQAFVDLESGNVLG